MIRLQTPCTSIYHSTEELEVLIIATLSIIREYNDDGYDFFIAFRDEVSISDGYAVTVGAIILSLNKPMNDILESLENGIEKWIELFAGTVEPKPVLPYQIKLPNRKAIKIQQVTKLKALGVEVCGMYSPRLNTIKINISKDIDTQWEALIHETLHAIEYQLEKNGEIRKDDKHKNCRHDFITYASPLIHKLIQSNL